MTLSTREIVVWSEVAEVLHRKMDLATAALEDANGERAVGRAQGVLAAYRDVLKIPAGLVAGDEMDKAEKKNREAVQASQDPRNWSLMANQSSIGRW